MAAAILLLGPNRWPSNTTDKEAGLKVREEIVAENGGVEWLLMERQPGQGDVGKFLALAKRSTHVFLIWPQDSKMVGTEDELILWMALKELQGGPELTLFHQRGVMATRVEGDGEDADEVLHIQDPQGRSPYLQNLLEFEPFLVEWSDVDNLKHQVQETLSAQLGVPRKARPGGALFKLKEPKPQP